MDEDQRRCCSGEDGISGLPDELLQEILVRLRSTRVAARTSLLSRRWRHVWAYMPELVLDDRGPAPVAAAAAAGASFMDAVDAALRACLAPALENLTISLSSACDLPPASRAAPWLLFASQRVVGTLSLTLLDDDTEEPELELPACTGAKSVRLDIPEHWKLRAPPVGLFAVLTSLTITCGRMEGSELTALVCTQCPRLSTLDVSTTLVATTDFTIRSNSLLSVWLWLDNTRRLEIVAPRLEDLCLSHTFDQAHICAPKLGKLVWHGDVYYHLVDVGRHLQLLDISIRQSEVVASLVQRFDEVDELKLKIYVPPGIAGYESFLNETNKLPKCKTLSISLVLKDHGLTSAMLHLLRSCNSTRTLSVQLHDFYHILESPCPSSCPCRFEESGGIDNVSLNSLEEIEITTYTSSHRELEFIEHLSRCNAPILKWLVINYYNFPDHPPTKETCEKIRNMCRSNIEVEFHVFSAKGHVRLDW